MQRDYAHIFHEPSAEARARLYYATSIGLYECDKSFYEDSYYTSGYYIIYVKAGRGYVWFDGRTMPVAAGHAAFIDLSAPYKYYADKDEPWEILWMHANGRDLPWFYDLICKNRGNVFIVPPNSRVPLYLRQAYDCSGDGGLACELQVSGAIHALLAELYGISRDFRCVYTNPAHEYPNALKRAADYIERNYFRKLLLKELAAVAYVSPHHLLRQFKKHTGFTPLQYTNQYRLSLAKQLLCQSDLTIEQIALNTGYCSHSYFGKCFHADTGVTPDQFRDQYKKARR